MWPYKDRLWGPLKMRLLGDRLGALDLFLSRQACCPPTPHSTPVLPGKETVTGFFCGPVTPEGHTAYLFGLDRLRLSYWVARPSMGT